MAQRRRTQRNQHQIWIGVGALVAIALIGFLATRGDGGSAQDVAAADESQSAPPTAAATAGAPEKTEPEPGPTPEELAAEKERADEAARRRERVTLSIEEHFPDLVEKLEDPHYADLVDTAFWLGLPEGREVSRGELADFQTRWTDEKTKAQEQLSALAENPLDLFEFRLAEVLERHYYFRDRFGSGEFQRFDHAPFILYVQELEGDAAGRGAEVAAEYGPELQALEREFKYNYAARLDLERQEGHEAYALFILTGKEQYTKYGELVHLQEGESGARAHYDPRYKIGVTYVEEGAWENMHAALHEMTHALEHAYFAHAHKQVWLPTWLAEGFAEYMASHQQSEEVPEWPVGILEMLLRQDPALAACVLPLEDLAQISNYGEAGKLLDERAQANGFPSLAPGLAMQFLYRQSHLLMHYLHDANDGEHRTKVREYISLMLRGKSPIYSLRTAFSGTDLANIDAGFLEFLKERGVDAELIDAVLATRD